MAGFAAVQAPQMQVIAASRGLVCAPNGATPRRFPLYTYSAKDFLRRRGYRQRFKERVCRAKAEVCEADPRQSRGDFAYAA